MSKVLKAAKLLNKFTNKLGFIAESIYYQWKISLILIKIYLSSKINDILF